MDDLLIIGLLGLGAWFLFSGNTGTLDIPPGGDFLQTIVNSAVVAIARAIAAAEGFYSPGSAPQRYNNPGDLANGDIGYGTFGAGLTIYPTLDDGWNALYHQVSMMLNGTSHVYHPSMTLSEVADKYTATQKQEWAANVAGKLGVTTDTTLQDISQSLA